MYSTPFRPFELQEGMVLTRDVHSLTKKSLILAKGETLSENHINKFIKLGVPIVYVNTEYDSKITSKDQEALEHALITIPKLIDLIDKIWGEIKLMTDQDVEPKALSDFRHEIDKILDDIILDIESQDLSLAVLFNASETEEGVFFQSAVQAYLSLLCAFQQKDYIHSEGKKAFSRKLAKSLALACVFTNISLADNPQLAKMKTSSLKLGMQDKFVLNHHQKSLDIFRDLKFQDAYAANIIFQHHQNMDGTNLSKDNSKPIDPDKRIPPVLTRIVQVADFYCSALNGFFVKKLVPPMAVLFEMKRVTDKFYHRASDLPEFVHFLTNHKEKSLPDFSGDRLDKIKHAKNDFARKIITFREFSERVFKILPQAYLESIVIPSDIFTQRFVGDRTILNCFFQLVPPFQLLDDVELSNGEFGVVTGFSQAYPCLPAVRITQDASGVEIPKQEQIVRNLSDQQSMNEKLRIKTLRSFDVEAYYYELDPIE